MKKISKHVIDLTGRKFGKLTVIKFNGINRLHSSLWECLCECGKMTEVIAANLKNSITRSCGCLKYENQYKSIENKAYGYHVSDCKKRGFKFHLPKDIYLEIARQPCTYCGEFSIRKNTTTGVEMKLNSVDRINNDPWYLIPGCQSLCFICQRMKNVMPHYEFMEHIKKIQQCKPGNNL